jgi:hypothetical protein
MAGRRHPAREGVDTVTPLFIGSVFRCHLCGVNFSGEGARSRFSQHVRTQHTSTRWLDPSIWDKIRDRIVSGPGGYWKVMPWAVDDG